MCNVPSQISFWYDFLHTVFCKILKSLLKMTTSRELFEEASPFIESMNLRDFPLSTCVLCNLWLPEITRSDYVTEVKCHRWASNQITLEPVCYATCGFLKSLIWHGLEVLPAKWLHNWGQESRVELATRSR